MQLGDVVMLIAGGSVCSCLPLAFFAAVLGGFFCRPVLFAIPAFLRVLGRPVLAPATGPEMTVGISQS